MVMAAPSPQQVGREFVRQYYTILHEAPEILHRFYSAASTFVHGGVDRPGHCVEEPVVGQLDIDKKIRQLAFKDCHTKIRQVDAQATIGSGVVVQVTGELSNNGEPMRRFMQTFVLAPQTPKKFYVHNDIFRYQDEVYQDLSDADEAAVSEEQQQAEAPLEPEPEQLQQSEPQHQVEVQEEPNGASEASVAHLHSASSSSGSSSSASSIANHVETVAVAAAAVPQAPEETAVVASAPVVVEPVVAVAQQQAPPQAQAEEPVREVKQPGVPSSWAKIITNKEAQQVSANPAVQQQQQPQSTGAPKQQREPRQPAAQQQQQQQQKTSLQNGSLNNKSNGKPHVPPQQQSSNNRQSTSSNQQPQQQQQQQQQPRENKENREHRESVNKENSKDLDLDDIEKRFGRYPDGQQIFVGNLNQDISEPELRDFFSTYGKVCEVRINANTKQQSGRRLPNYGFVVFEERQAVEALLGNSKSSNVTYKSDKGAEYRLNVEEKRNRQGRGNRDGGGFKGANRSTSNGSANNGPAKRNFERRDFNEPPHAETAARDGQQQQQPTRNANNRSNGNGRRS